MTRLTTTDIYPVYMAAHQDHLREHFRTQTAAQGCGIICVNLLRRPSRTNEFPLVIERGRWSYGSRHYHTVVQFIPLAVIEARSRIEPTDIRVAALARSGYPQQMLGMVIEPTCNPSRCYALMDVKPAPNAAALTWIPHDSFPQATEEEIAAALAAGAIDHGGIMMLAEHSSSHVLVFNMDGRADETPVMRAQRLPPEIAFMPREVAHQFRIGQPYDESWQQVVLAWTAPAAPHARQGIMAWGLLVAWDARLHLRAYTAIETAQREMRPQLLSLSPSVLLLTAFTARMAELPLNPRTDSLPRWYRHFCYAYSRLVPLFDSWLTDWRSGSTQAAHRYTTTSTHRPPLDAPPPPIVEQWNAAFGSYWYDQVVAAERPEVQLLAALDAVSADLWRNPRQVPDELARMVLPWACWSHPDGHSVPIPRKGRDLVACWRNGQQPHLYSVDRS